MRAHMRVRCLGEQQKHCLTKVPSRLAPQAGVSNVPETALVPIWLASVEQLATVTEPFGNRSLSGVGRPAATSYSDVRTCAGFRMTARTDDAAHTGAVHWPRPSKRPSPQLRSVSGEQLPDLSRSRQNGSFRMRFERDVIACTPDPYDTKPMCPSGSSAWRIAARMALMPAASVVSWT